MRVPFIVPAALGLALFAADCGKSPGSSGSAGPAAATAPPVLEGPTDAEKAAALAAPPPAYRRADLDNGEAKFALCRSCHTAARYGANMVGPNLYGVFGRRAGTLPGFSYSDALKSSKIVWNAETLNRWIENPRTDVPGTKMTYPGMESAKDRIDVIAYLELATTSTGR